MPDRGSHMNRSQYSTEQQRDVDALTILRERFSAALVSGKAEDLTPLLTDDYVYFQPNHEGPCTYGRAAHLGYIPSLPKVHEATIELIDFILMGRWAFESGEEICTEEGPDGGKVKQIARFSRLSYRNEAGVWQMARTFRGMALDLKCVREPPKPGFITNSGRGHWQAMPIDIECAQETAMFLAADKEGLRQMVRDFDPGSGTLAQSVEMTPEHRFVSVNGIYTWQDYKDFQKVNIAKNALDELEKYDDDARVMVPGQWAYSFGKGIGCGVIDRDGAAVRRGGVHLFFYLWQRIDEGNDPWPWKMHSSFGIGMFDALSPLDKDNPSRSDLIHRRLEKQRQEAVRAKQ